MPRSILIVTSQARTVHSGVGTYAAMILAGLGRIRSAGGPYEAGDDVPGAVGPVVSVATWDTEIDREGHPDLEWIGLGAVASFDPTPGRFWTLGRRLVAALGDAGSQFDVVHFLDAREGHAFVRSRSRHRATRVVGTVHDDYAALVGRNPLHYRGAAADPWRRFLFHRWLRRVEGRCYPRFDRLLVNSAATAATVRAAYGLDPQRMTRATLTIEPRPPEAHVALAGSPRLVFCGGNFYRKGLDTCVAALPELLREHPELRLHVVGTCRAGSRIRMLATRLGVAPAICWHGRVAPDAAAARMAAADVFVMPSRTEALGLVYLEAFRAGVPVIAGDRGGVTEIVVHERSGLLVPPASPAALAAAVTRLVRDAGLRQRVIAGGREVLAARTPERLVAETLDAYGLQTAAPIDASRPGVDLAAAVH